MRFQLIPNTQLPRILRVILLDEFDELEAIESNDIRDYPPFRKIVSRREIRRREYSLDEYIKLQGGRIIGELHLFHAVPTS